MLLYIAVGGGLGALARFAAGAWMSTWAGTAFPWPTFAINVLGSALLGFLNGSLPRLTVSPDTRGLLTIGLCGGFTTFSTFDLETLRLLEHGRHLAAAAYSAGSVTACLVGVFAGLRLASWFIRPRLAA
jgi:fluoride exporter